MLDLRNERVVVTGASGFLGQHLMDELDHRGVVARAVSSTEYDLRNEQAVQALYTDLAPTVLFHLAAEVGGIGANSMHPGQFFYNNLLMGAYLIEYGRRNALRKFVSVGTVCSYPKHTEVPFQEDRIWDGYPEETNAPYGLAKKMQLVQLQAYRDEWGFKGVHLLPGNLYGPYDHFDAENGHVIPSIILKMQQAILNGDNSVTLWGDGSPTREFLFARDCARGICQAAEVLEDCIPVNLGTGIETSIRDAAELIAEIMGFAGTIHWDTNRPNGQPRRSLDTSRASSLFGFRADVPLREGLEQTVHWFRQQPQVRSGARGFAR